MPVRNLGDYPQTVGKPTWETIASAGTISPKTDRVRTTGAVTISTINRPHSYFIGPLYLWTVGASATDAAGNIVKAVTGVANRVLTLFFDPATNKWIPSA